MLPWRALSPRIAGIARRNVVPTSRRLLHQSLPKQQYQYAARPTGFMPRIWFRADGTPRSKLFGLSVGSFIVFSALMVYSAADLIGEYDTVNYVLTSLVYLQKADTTYDSTDFSNIKRARDYFFEICTSIPDTPQQVVVDFFDEIDPVLDSNSPQAEQLHQLMKSSSEEIHDLLKKLTKENSLQLGLEILRALDRTILAVADLVQEFHGGEDGDKVVYHLIRENKSKDPSSRGAEYGSIG